MNLLTRFERGGLAAIQGPVDALLREVGASTILPRFRQLRPFDMTEKTPGEIVTIVDQEAEQILTERLGLILPGSRIVGE